MSICERDGISTLKPYADKVTLHCKEAVCEGDSI